MPSKQFLLEHDEISIREAFERLLNGLEVTNAYGRVYKMENKDNLNLLVQNPKNLNCPDKWEGGFTLLNIVDHKFYVKKPFNVRKALMENSDEYAAKVEIIKDLHPPMPLTYYLFFDSKEMAVFYSLSPKKEVGCDRLKDLKLLDRAIPFVKEEYARGKETCSS